MERIYSICLFEQLVQYSFVEILLKELIFRHHNDKQYSASKIEFWNEVENINNETNLNQLRLIFLKLLIKHRKVCDLIKEQRRWMQEH